MSLWRRISAAFHAIGIDSDREDNPMTPGWDRRHQSTRRHHPPVMEPLVEELERCLTPRGLVLDHGCGAGRLSARLAALGQKLVLNDISREALRRARARLELLHLADQVVGIWERNVDEFPGDSVFDSLVSHRVVSTLTHGACDRTVGGFSRLLKTGGRGLISVRSIYCPGVERYRRKPRFIETHDHTFERRRPRRVMRFFDEGELDAHLEAAGLIVDGCRLHEESSSKISEDSPRQDNVYVTYRVRKR